MSPFPNAQPFGNNYPLRHGKGSVHDGGTKVPTIYFNPKLSSSTRGKKRDFLMHISDWLPTFVELSGQKVRGKIIQSGDHFLSTSNFMQFYVSGCKGTATADSLFIVMEHILYTIITALL